MRAPAPGGGSSGIRGGARVNCIFLVNGFGVLCTGQEILDTVPERGGGVRIFGHARLNC